MTNKPGTRTEMLYRVVPLYRLSDAAPNNASMQPDGVTFGKSYRARGFSANFNPVTAVIPQHLIPLPSLPPDFFYKSDFLYPRHVYRYRSRAKLYLVALAHQAWPTYRDGPRGRLRRRTSCGTTRYKVRVSCSRVICFR